MSGRRSSDAYGYLVAKLHFNFFVGGDSDNERTSYRHVIFTVFVFCCIL